MAERRRRPHDEGAQTISNVNVVSGRTYLCEYGIRTDCWATSRLLNGVVVVAPETASALFEDPGQQP